MDGGHWAGVDLCRCQPKSRLEGCFDRDATRLGECDLCLYLALV